MIFWKVTFVTDTHGKLVVPVAKDSELEAIVAAMEMAPFAPEYTEVWTERLESKTLEALTVIKELHWDSMKVAHMNRDEMNEDQHRRCKYRYDSTDSAIYVAICYMWME